MFYQSPAFPKNPRTNNRQFVETEEYYETLKELNSESSTLVDYLLAIGLGIVIAAGLFYALSA